LVKILNDKKHLFNTVNSGHTVFQGKHKLFKILKDKKDFNAVKNFGGNSYSGQAQVQNHE